MVGEEKRSLLLVWVSDSNMKILSSIHIIQIKFYHLFGMMVTSLCSNMKLNEVDSGVLSFLCANSRHDPSQTFLPAGALALKVWGPQSLLECWSAKRLSSQTGEPPKENPPMKCDQRNHSKYLGVIIGN